MEFVIFQNLNPVLKHKRKLEGRKLRILEGGTAYQTDIGMCGDYNSVIGMNRDNSLNKFLKESSTKKHFPALGKATISGVLVTADEKTGLALEIQQIILGGALQERF